MALDNLKDQLEEAEQQMQEEATDEADVDDETADTAASAGTEEDGEPETDSESTESEDSTDSGGPTDDSTSDDESAAGDDASQVPEPQDPKTVRAFDYAAVRQNSHHALPEAWSDYEFARTQAKAVLMDAGFEDIQKSEFDTAVFSLARRHPEELAEIVAENRGVDAEEF